MLNLLVTLLIIMIVIGVLWYVMGLLPIPQPFKNIALAILGLIFVIWLLGAVFGSFPLPRLVS